MEDKIICPWCGAEMETRAHKNRSNAIGWTKCQNIDCGADGPIVTGKTAVECADKARAAALRRYTPPLKPMTLEEVRKEITGWAAWLETKDREPQTVKMAERTGGMVFQQEGSNELYGVHYDTYNKYWRCWSRKPTDEERSAAEWEK